MINEIKKQAEDLRTVIKVLKAFGKDCSKEELELTDYEAYLADPNGDRDEYCRMMQHEFEIAKRQYNEGRY